MSNIGAEIGQKMRSAIQAKLMELGCYVDDELPDYIMVMVANKRSKSQMNEDLNLFLASKTSTFVNWLHIVLKKLKEVTVTNPEVYKKASVKKRGDSPNSKDEKLKYEKIDKKIKEEIISKLVKSEKSVENTDLYSKSLTDNLPLQITNKFTEKRKITITTGNDDIGNTSNNKIAEDNFDIPLLSEVNVKDNGSESTVSTIKNKTNDTIEPFKECKQNEQKSSHHRIDTQKRSNKSINSNNIMDEKFYTGKLYSDSANKSINNPSTPTVLSTVKKSVHDRITYIDSDRNNQQSSRITTSKRRRDDNSNSLDERHRSPLRKKKSISDRLGRRLSSPNDRSRRLNSQERGFEKYNSSPNRKNNSQKHQIYRSRSREEESFSDEDIIERPGVQSKVSVIKRGDTNHQTTNNSDEDDERVVREVPSLIRVKPRVIPADVVQPNKSLLLKAVAEAQRSVAQAPKVGKNIKPDALFTKKYKQKNTEINKPKGVTKRHLAQIDRNKLKALIEQSSDTNSLKSRLKKRNNDDEFDGEKEYVPKPLKSPERELPKYIPSLIHIESADINNDLENGSNKPELSITVQVRNDSPVEKKTSIKARLDGRNVPSPIIFDKTDDTETAETLNELPIVRTPMKINEKCKYWPNCRQSDTCEYVHPSGQCEVFPHCKFGNKCLFIHPKCKFGNSCTKRNCIYEHYKTSINLKLSMVATKVQKCKYYPLCTNKNCQFLHPKLSKYEKFGNNNSKSSFSHSVINKNNFTWKSK